MLFPGGALLAKTAEAFNTPPIFTNGAEAASGAVQAVASASVGDRSFDWMTAVAQQLSLLVGMYDTFGDVARVLLLNFSFLSTMIIPAAKLGRGMLSDFQSLYIDHANKVK